MDAVEQLEDKGKILIFGYAGTTPAAIHAILHAFKDHFSKSYSQIDILFAVTDISASSFQRLKKQPLPDNFNFLEEFQFEENKLSKFSKKISDISTEYKKIIFHTKGGMNRWIIPTLMELKDVGAKLQTLQSDGHSAILCDNQNYQLEKFPLASLPVAEHLKLLGASYSFQGEDGPALKDVRITIEGRSLHTVLASCIKNYLRVWIDISTWGINESTNEYLKKWRTTLDVIKDLKISREHVTLIIGPDTPYKVKLRATSEGFFYTKSAPSPQEAISAGKAGHSAKKFPDAGTPSNISAPKDGVQNNRSLAVAQSGLNSTSTLNAITAHNARLNLIIYDNHSYEIKEAAFRIEQLVRNAVKGDSLYGRTFYFVPSNHTGSKGVREFFQLCSKQNKQIEVNITPGTKEQGIALALAAGEEDQIFELKSTPNIQVLKESLNDNTREPAASTTLSQSAYFCGGDHIVNRTFTPETTQEEAKELSHNVFEYLSKIQIKKTLSHQFSKPNSTVYCDEQGQFTYSGRKPIDLFSLYAENSQRESIGPNEWMELFVATEMIRAGADEVLQGVEWKWKTGPDGTFRNEVDVLARFGPQIFSISCKTSAPLPDKMEHLERWWSHHFEHNYVTRISLGTFARPFVAFPIVKPEGAYKLPGNFLWADDLSDTERLRELLNIRAKS